MKNKRRGEKKFFNHVLKPSKISNKQCFMIVRTRVQILHIRQEALSFILLLGYLIIMCTISST